MTLRHRVIKDVRSGVFGPEGLIKRQELIRRYSDVNPKTTGCFLSNSEMRTGVVHSPTYRHFTQRVARGIYRLHLDVELDTIESNDEI